MYFITQPRLKQGGDHRWIVDTGFATLLVHYQEMLAAGEATDVLVKLQTHTRKLWGGEIDAHSMLLSWGTLIRRKFESDNLPVTCRTQHFPQIAPVVQQVVDMGTRLSEVECSAACGG